MDVRSQIAILRERLPLLVVSVLLAAIAAFVVSSLQPKSYEAKATLIVGQALSAVSTDYNQLLVSQRLSKTYASIATKRPILDNVIEQLSLNVTAEELAQRVQADVPLDNTLFTISARDGDPVGASAIANALAEQLIAMSSAIQGREAEFQASIDTDLKATQAQINATQTQVEALTRLTDPTAAQNAQLATLEGRLVTLRSTYATVLSFSSGNASNMLTVIEPAVPPTAPISPRPLLNTLLAAVIGLLLAAGVVAVLEFLDESIKDPIQLRAVAGLNTLGTIGRMKGGATRSEIYRLAALLYPLSAAAEAYRALRTNIEFASVDAPIKTLLVTSSIPGEGKTVTAANLAVVFAQAGRRVLLVDADLRKPAVHVIFDLPNSHGLTSLLRSDEVSIDAVARPTEQANLRVVTTGPLPPNPVELLGSQRMRVTVERLAAEADLVIFDSGPLNAVTDALLLSSFLDGTIVVIHARHGRRPAIRRATEALSMAGATVLGAALNDIPTGPNSDYPPYYGADYGSEKETEGQGPGSSTPIPR